MIAALGFILDGIVEIGSMGLWAGETCINVLLGALVAGYTFAIGLLPGMNDAPVIGNPTWLGWLNWFYPVGPLVGGLASLVGMWIAFLAARYLLRLVRGI